MAGCEVHSLCILASESNNSHYVDIERLRDTALEELGFANPNSPAGICQSIAIRHRDVWLVNGIFRALLEDAASHYVIHKVSELHALYLLHHAWQELDEFSNQWYLDGMSPQNAIEITREQIEKFVASQSAD